MATEITYEEVLKLYNAIRDAPPPKLRVIGIFYHWPGEKSEDWKFCPNPCHPAALERFKKAVADGAIEEPWYGH